jgi:hypothetical protein
MTQKLCNSVEHMVKLAECEVYRVRAGQHIVGVYCL